ncbi:sine oculis-binding protein homolog [Drosophila busckii]|uniref:sine oculis-binding protein homolog n=1 Tax=Drosophila busckii TaxID=30019 RepID=UPI00143323D6|nr:sine oculis-binding protein homolog [Drosophila busckii]
MLQEFAQHTMNELLGWYGFDGVDVDRLDLTAKTSRLLQSAAAAAAATQQQQQQRVSLRSTRSFLTSYHNNNNSSSSNNNNGLGSHRKSNCHSNITTPSDHDTRSSREDDSKSPHSIGKSTATPAAATTITAATSLATDEKIDLNSCCWCHRAIAENAPDYLTSTDGPRYCSESCFTQSRRASFKKAKTCDWCKHVRHAVSYVDFQDGASQLQFCSEKCLNQYKMQIFCNETQAHLDMNPHLRDQPSADAAGLITPELWLRNCRSRSASPASTISVSPGPANASKRSSPCATPPHLPSKPLISVAPASKLLAQKTAAPTTLPPRHAHNALKPGRRKRSHRGGALGSETVASLLHKQQQHHHHQQQQQQHQSAPPLGVDFAGSSVPLPPLSPMPEPPAPASAQPPQLPPQPPQLCHPPNYFATPPNGALGPHPFGARPAPHPFLPPPPGLLPRGFGARFPGLPPPTPAPMHELHNALGIPPVTVMVPYPVIIPLPIPIPIPLPVMDFYKAYLTPEERKKPATEEQPQPLDCSKARSEQDEEQEDDAEQLAVEEELQSEQQLPREQELPELKHIPKTTTDNNDAATTTTATSSPATSPATVEETTTSTSPSITPTHCIVQAENSSSALGEKLPKLKITRLQSRATASGSASGGGCGSGSGSGSGSVANSSAAAAAAECSRPLRKRKRIIDCDFQKITLRGELESVDGQTNNNNNNSNPGKRKEEGDEDEVCNTNSNCAKAKK